MNPQWITRIILALSMCLLPFGQAAAGAEPSLSLSQAYPSSDQAVHKKVWILSVPGLSFVELSPAWNEALPSLMRLREGAHWGSLNIRTPGKGLEDVYLSIGAGHFAEGGPGVQGLQRSELIYGQEAAQWIQRLTGRPSESAILVKDAEAMRRMNATNYYRAAPGTLGQKLEAAGVRISVWGNADRARPAGGWNADSNRMLRRYAPLMLMNDVNEVAHGDVSGGQLNDPYWPAGLRTDTRWMLDRWREQPASSVALMEIGDLARLYDEKVAYSRAAFERMKLAVLSELDRFVGEAVRMIDQAPASEHNELWLFSPQVNADAVRAKAYLAPLLMYAPSVQAEEALLTSATTRRSGIVSLIDLAPTLLERFGIEKPEAMLGLPIHSERKEEALPALLQQVRSMQSVYALRPPLLYGLAIYEIAVMLAVLAAVMFGSRLMGRRSVMVCVGLLFSLLLAPAGLLSMGWLPSELPVFSTILALGSVLAISVCCAYYAASKPGRTVVCLAGIGIVVTLLLLYDGMHGARAMQRSVLGYDPMIGARYYGMGNECMGVLLGASLLGLTAMQQSLRLGKRRSAGTGKGGKDSAASPAASSGALPPDAYAAALLHGPASEPAAVTAWRLPPAGRLAPLLRAGSGLAARAAAAPGALRGSRLAARAGAAWRTWPAAAVGAAVAGYLAAPTLGTNAGGALSAAVAFGALGARLAGGRRWVRAVPALALLLAAALVGLWLLNASAAMVGSADKQSHIGRAFHTLLQGRFDLIGVIIMRKLEMNWHLIGVSAWSKVLLTSLIVMAVLVLRPRGLFRRWQRRYPYIMYGCAANVIGAIAALLLNDSGIVAAATMIVYSSIPLLLLKLEGV
ncbi:hypothetical protein [Paenibacillus sp. OAS669]|uniref:hypothetical protein n=1 Tax=Paenibacillus sp. OAS669 TaxID=2663821 RepID=UPI00178B8297|nr:hypothetical protein [Paenibacillus sp. OAS669]MBE1445699.1 hypothetical protein [Paenibacillus sp. OAS669]